MLKLLILIPLLCCLTPAASAQRAKAGRVAARFGGECAGVPLKASTGLRRLIQRERRRTASPCDRPSCEGAFAFDLDGDRRREFFVRLSCGATGNCTWGVFSERPARLRGVFTAWFFYVGTRAGGWSALTTYTRQGGERGTVAALRYRRGRYVVVSERADVGYAGNPQPFLRRAGVPDCDLDFRGAR